MGLFILRRLLVSVPVLFLATVVTFFGVSAVGDPLSQLAIIPDVSQDTIANLIERNRLDEPLYVQYWAWLQSVVTDQFGTNFAGRPIWPNLRVALFFTVQLLVVAELLSLAIGVALGVISAKRQYSTVDYATTTVSFLGFAMPAFWFALILQVLATTQYQATDVRLFYTTVAGLASADELGFFMLLVERAQRFTLPILVISLASVAIYSRYMRSSMLEVMGSDYVRTARAKGVRERFITRKHEMRTALIPIATLAALNFGTVFTGVIVVEVVFAIPGMGRFFISALNEREVYEVMAFLLVTAVFVIIANLVADIVYGFLDPRIRYD